MASDPCAGLTGAELRHCLLLQYGSAVEAMCDGNLLTEDEAAGLKAIGSGLAMDRVPGPAHGHPFAGADNPEGGAA